MKRVDLTEDPRTRLARLLKAQDARLGRLETRPTGVKHLGTDGDVIWDGPRWIPDPEGGPPQPTIEYETWSLKDVPKVTETLSIELEAAESRIAEARAALDGMQGLLDSVTIDVDGLNGQIGDLQAAAQQAAVDAAAAQAAADQAAQDAADALEAAQNASGKQQIFFGPNPPAIGDPDVLWIDDDGVPHQWQGTPPDTGEWVIITDTRIVDAAQDAAAAQDTAHAAQQAAQDAADAAQDAQQAAQDAQDAAVQAIASANSRNSRIISLQPASGDLNPQTGNPLVEGDTWWQWDNTTDRNVIGAWVWRDGAWQAETLANTVLGSLDVNKLLVLGTARMNEAVVEKIFGDAAYFNLINVEDLTVTGTADINEAVVAKIAAAQITLRVLRSEVDPDTNLYAVFDSFGLRVIDNEGPEGDPVPVIQLGPSGTNLLQLGTPETGQALIDSAGGVTAVHGSFNDLWVGGQKVRTDFNDRPRGVITRAVMVGGYSRKLNGRGVVLGLEADLEPGRLYQIHTNSPVCENEKAECEPMLELQITLDGSAPESNWNGNKRAESSIGWYPNWRNHPPMHAWVDLRDRPVGGPPVWMRAAISLGNRANNGWCMVSNPVQPCEMWVEDRGTSVVDRAHPFFDSGGGGQQQPREHKITRWTPTGWATYIRGGSRDFTEKPTQGQWSQWNRSCYFFFDDMTAELAGADIRRITLFSWADHWANPTGTARWHWHGMFGGIPESGQQSTFMVDTPGWPRGSARTIDIIPEEFGLWQNGTARGFGFTTWDTGHEFYGQFSPLLDAHFVEIDYYR